MIRGGRVCKVGKGARRSRETVKVGLTGNYLAPRIIATLRFLKP